MGFINKESKMIAQILEKPPISGSIEEILFDTFGECTWVKFSGDNREWVGVFGNGHVLPDIHDVAVFSAGTCAFIIAGGQGYLINLTTRSLVLKMRNDYLKRVVAVPDQDIAIIADGYSTLIGCDSSGMLWESECNGGDNIQLVSITKETAYGKIWIPPDHAWYSFQYDINKRTFENMTFLTNEIDAF